MFDKNKFDPLDKVIIIRQGETYYALSSFCGFDMTDLSNGVALGNKIICPTCLSEFNIEDGKANFGPTFNNLASFPIINVN